MIIKAIINIVCVAIYVGIIIGICMLFGAPLPGVYETVLLVLVGDVALTKQDKGFYAS